MLTILGNTHSVFNQFLSEIRDAQTQKDRLRFRRNLERVGEIFAYEISKTLPYIVRNIKTPLGEASVHVLKEQPVIAAVLRAALPLHQGLLNYFDQAENAFISAYRKHHKDGSFNVHVEYLACPDLNNKILILADPMLASGSSLELTWKALLQRGVPAMIHVVSLIASKEGLEYVKKNMPLDVHFWVGAIDEQLTKESYIVPGLGDAGDLAFGEKL